MKKQILKCNSEKATPPFPRWLKSYHLLIFAFAVMLLFGIAVKHITAT